MSTESQKVFLERQVHITMFDNITEFECSFYYDNIHTL